jgi:transposase
MNYKFTVMTRKKYTSKFKTKVVLETLKERSSIAELAQKHDLSPQQVNLWKREFLSKADSVFESKAKSKKTQAEEEKDQLLKSIGHLKVDNDFLMNALR